MRVTVVVTVITAMVMMIGCASTQPQLSLPAPPESQEFLFQAKAEAKEGQVNTSVELRGPVEIVKEASSGFARAQWCKNQKAVSVLNGQIDSLIMKKE